MPGISPAPREGGRPAAVVTARRARSCDAPELEEALTRKHSMPRLLTIGASLLFVAAACGGGGASATPGGAPTNAASQPAGSQAAGAQPWVPDPTKLAAAIAEGGTDNPKGLPPPLPPPPQRVNHQELST